MKESGSLFKNRLDLSAFLRFWMRLKKVLGIFRMFILIFILL